MGTNKGDRDNKDGRGRQPGNFLDGHRERIVGWLADGLRQAEVLTRLQDEYSVRCAKGTLSEYIKRTGLLEEVARRRQGRPTTDPPPTNELPLGRTVEPPAELPNEPSCEPPGESANQTIHSPPSEAADALPDGPPPVADAPPIDASSEEEEWAILVEDESQPASGDAGQVASTAGDARAPGEQQPNNRTRPASPPPPPPPDPGSTAGRSSSTPPSAGSPVSQPADYPEPSPGPLWPLDLPILEFGGGDITWTLGDACEGTFILGATGSGKTSGSGRTLARAFMESGFGGLVLTVKPGECEEWARLAWETGRLDEFGVVRPGEPLRMNFLVYELYRTRKAGGGGEIDGVVNLLHTVLEVQARGGGHGPADAFWVNAEKQLIRNVLRIILYARPALEIRLEQMLDLVAEAPKSLEAAKSGNWEHTSCFGPLFLAALRNAMGQPSDVPMMNAAKRYWMQEYPALADKTRASIITRFTAMVDGLFDPAIHELLCQDTTITPEALLMGGILVIDLPVKTYQQVGVLAQSIWKLLFQRTVESRQDPDDATRRPVFLWVDESQFFHSDYDTLFQSTARSSRCATVYLTQNIAGYHGLFGQHRDLVDGFLGNLNTKIFHANNDPASNKWAAEQIGRTKQFRTTVNSGDGDRDKGTPSRSGTSISEQVDYPVQPSEFMKLRMGGPRFGGLVDAYFVKSGARFAPHGKHYFQTTFRQEQRP